MNQVKNILGQAVIHKMAILVVVLFSLNSLCDAILISFLNVEWSTVSTESKILIVIGIFKTWSGVMIVYFTKNVKNVQAGRSPFDDPTPSGGTSFLAKQKENG